MHILVGIVIGLLIAVVIFVLWAKRFHWPS
jgi:tetrahydromethanopterin S-methyltransferase subunit G